MTNPSRTRRPAADRRGSTSVEFAFVLPIILGLFLGLWEYARIEMIRNATSAACFEGAREGTLLGADTDSMDAAAQNVLDIYGLDGSVISTTVNDHECTCDISVPLSENTWVAFYVLPNRHVTASCEFSRELFGD